MSPRWSRRTAHVATLALTVLFRSITGKQNETCGFLPHELLKPGIVAKIVQDIDVIDKDTIASARAKCTELCCNHTACHGFSFMAGSETGDNNFKCRLALFPFDGARVAASMNIAGIEARGDQNGQNEETRGDQNGQSEVRVEHWEVFKADKKCRDTKLLATNHDSIMYQFAKASEKESMDDCRKSCCSRLRCRAFSWSEDLELKCTMYFVDLTDVTEDLTKTASKDDPLPASSLTQTFLLSSTGKCMCNKEACDTKANRQDCKSANTRTECLSKFYTKPAGGVERNCKWMYANDISEDNNVASTADFEYIGAGFCRESECTWCNHDFKMESICLPTVDACKLACLAHGSCCRGVSFSADTDGLPATVACGENAGRCFVYASLDVDLEVEGFQKTHSDFQCFKLKDEAKDRLPVAERGVCWEAEGNTHLPSYLPTPRPTLEIEMISGFRAVGLGFCREDHCSVCTHDFVAWASCEPTVEACVDKCKSYGDCCRAIAYAEASKRSKDCDEEGYGRCYVYTAKDHNDVVKVKGSQWTHVDFTCYAVRDEELKRLDPMATCPVKPEIETTWWNASGSGSGSISASTDGIASGSWVFSGSSFGSGYGSGSVSSSAIGDLRTAAPAPSGTPNHSSNSPVKGYQHISSGFCRERNCSECSHDFESYPSCVTGVEACARECELHGPCCRGFAFSEPAFTNTCGYSTQGRCFIYTSSDELVVSGSQDSHEHFDCYAVKEHHRVALVAEKVCRAKAIAMPTTPAPSSLLTMPPTVGYLSGYEYKGQGFCREQSCSVCRHDFATYPKCVPDMSACVAECEKHGSCCRGVSFAEHQHSRTCQGTLGRCFVYTSSDEMVIAGSQKTHSEFHCYGVLESHRNELTHVEGKCDMPATKTPTSIPTVSTIETSVNPVKIPKGYDFIGTGFCRDNHCSSCSHTFSIEPTCQASLHSCAAACERHGACCRGVAWVEPENTGTCKDSRNGRCFIYTSVDQIIKGSQNSHEDWTCYAIQEQRRKELPMAEDLCSLGPHTDVPTWLPTADKNYSPETSPPSIHDASLAPTTKPSRSPSIEPTIPTGYDFIGSGFCRATHCSSCLHSFNIEPKCTRSLDACLASCESHGSCCRGVAWLDIENTFTCRDGEGRCFVYISEDESVKGSQGSHQNWSCYAIRENLRKQLPSDVGMCTGPDTGVPTWSPTAKLRTMIPTTSPVEEVPTSPPTSVRSIAPTHFPSVPTWSPTAKLRTMIPTTSPVEEVPSSPPTSVRSIAPTPVPTVVVSGFEYIGSGFCRDKHCSSCMHEFSIQPSCERSLHDCAAACERHGACCRGVAWNSPEDSPSCGQNNNGRCFVYTSEDEFVRGSVKTHNLWSCYAIQENRRKDLPADAGLCIGPDTDVPTWSPTAELTHTDVPTSERSLVPTVAPKEEDVKGFEFIGVGFCREMHCSTCSHPFSIELSCERSLHDCTAACERHGACCRGVAWINPEDSSAMCNQQKKGRCFVYISEDEFVKGSSSNHNLWSCYAIEEHRRKKLSDDEGLCIGPTTYVPTWSPTAVTAEPMFELSVAPTVAPTVTPGFKFVGYGFCRDSHCSSCGHDFSVRALCKRSLHDCALACEKQGACCRGIAWMDHANTSTCAKDTHGRCFVYTSVDLHVEGSANLHPDYSCYAIEQEHREDLPAVDGDMCSGSATDLPSWSPTTLDTGAPTPSPISIEPTPDSTTTNIPGFMFKGNGQCAEPTCSTCESKYSVDISCEKNTEDCAAVCRSHGSCCAGFAFSGPETTLSCMDTVHGLCWIYLQDPEGDRWEMREGLFVHPAVEDGPSGKLIKDIYCYEAMANPRYHDWGECTSTKPCDKLDDANTDGFLPSIEFVGKGLCRESSCSDCVWLAERSCQPSLHACVAECRRQGKCCAGLAWSSDAWGGGCDGEDGPEEEHGECLIYTNNDTETTVNGIHPQDHFSCYKISEAERPYLNSCLPVEGHSHQADGPDGPDRADEDFKYIGDGVCRETFCDSCQQHEYIMDSSCQPTLEACGGACASHGECCLGVAFSYPINDGCREAGSDVVAHGYGDCLIYLASSGEEGIVAESEGSTIAGVLPQSGFKCYAAQDGARRKWGECHEVTPDEGDQRPCKATTLKPSTVDVLPTKEPKQTYKDPMDGRVDGEKKCYAINTKLLGRNFKSEKTTEDELCRTMCLSEPKCHYWTYDSASSRCYLKSTDGGREYAAAFTSGQSKGCENWSKGQKSEAPTPHPTTFVAAECFSYDVMYHGQVMKTAEVLNAISCLNMCRMTEPCYEWSFFENECVLYETITGEQYQYGAVSGQNDPCELPRFGETYKQGPRYNVGSQPVFIVFDRVEVNKAGKGAWYTGTVWKAELTGEKETFLHTVIYDTADVENNIKPKNIRLLFASDETLHEYHIGVPVLAHPTPSERHPDGTVLRRRAATIRALQPGGLATIQFHLDGAVQTGVELKKLRPRPAFVVGEKATAETCQWSAVTVESRQPTDAYDVEFEDGYHQIVPYKNMRKGNPPFETGQTVTVQIDGDKYSGTIFRRFDNGPEDGYTYEVGVAKLGTLRNFKQDEMEAVDNSGR